MHLGTIPLSISKTIPRNSYQILGEWTFVSIFPTRISPFLLLGFFLTSDLLVTLFPVYSNGVIIYPVVKSILLSKLPSSLCFRNYLLWGCRIKFFPFSMFYTRFHSHYFIVLIYLRKRSVSSELVNKQNYVASSWLHPPPARSQWAVVTFVCTVPNQGPRALILVVVSMNCYGSYCYYTIVSPSVCNERTG